MEDRFTLEILVPAGSVVKEEVSAVNLPTALGQVGILPQHCDYTALLGTGILDYTPSAGTAKKLVISGGFVSFSKDKLKVLADSVDLPESAQKNAILQNRDSLEKITRDNPIDSAEWIAAKAGLDRISAIEQLGSVG